MTQDLQQKIENIIYRNSQADDSEILFQLKQLIELHYEPKLPNEAEKLYEDETFVVIHPKTRAASCHYGKDTLWCTAAKRHNKFGYYNRKGKLYIIINKRCGKKYQFHAETKSFMNEENEPINNGTYTLKKINATQGLFNFFASEIPYLYDEFLYVKKYNTLPENNSAKFIDNIDDYKCMWDMYHEFDYNRCTYYIGVKNTCCTLYCAKSAGQILRINQIIGTTFNVDKIIPFKSITRKNELVIVKGKHTGIYHIDTDTIRWGYKGFIDDSSTITSKYPF